jgi:heptaprenyl diphosphate synthase
LLAASLGSYNLANVLHAAAAVELIHAASLVHDDLVDDADQRRGNTTVHVRWNNDVALMVGDYFFAVAAEEMSLAPDPRVVRVYAQAVRTLVEGELNPVTLVAPLNEALAQYVGKIGSKTAALFEAACKAGMICGGGDDEQIAALGRFGYDLGLAFQIVDDVLDYSGDERVLGKPAGNDLRQGTITLPLIYAVANGAGGAATEPLDTATPSDAQVALAVDEVIRWGGVADARMAAERYARRAQSHLHAFVDAPARDALSAIAQFVVERSS